MQVTTLSIGICLISTLVGCGAEAPSSQPEQVERLGKPFAMTIDVSGLKSDLGRVQLGLYSNEVTYTSEEVFESASLEIKSGRSQWLISDLPAGEYAIKSFHDENADGKMNLNMMGLPDENYAFSGKVKSRFGPPKFKEAKVSLSPDHAVYKLIFE